MPRLKLRKAQSDRVSDAVELANTGVDCRAGRELTAQPEQTSIAAKAKTNPAIIYPEIPPHRRWVGMRLDSSLMLPYLLEIRLERGDLLRMHAPKPAPYDTPGGAKKFVPFPSAIDDSPNDPDSIEME